MSEFCRSISVISTYLVGDVESSEPKLGIARDLDRDLDRDVDRDVDRDLDADVDADLDGDLVIELALDERLLDELLAELSMSDESNGFFFLFFDFFFATTLAFFFLRLLSFIALLTSLSRIPFKEPFERDDDDAPGALVFLVGN